MRCAIHPAAVAQTLLIRPCAPVAQVSLPYQVKRILNMFSLAVSFGFSDIGTPLECLGLRGYLYELLTFIIAPISIAFLAGTIGVYAKRAIKGRLSYKEILEAGLPSFLRIMFFACTL